MAEAVEGLQQMLRAVKKMDSELGKEIQKALKDGIGGPFVRDVQSLIESLGLVKSGKLERSIKPSLRNGVLYIRSTPPLNPGPNSKQGYAAIYEYGGRTTKKHGPRAFMNPTADRWLAEGKTEQAFGVAIDGVIARSGFNG